MDAFGAINEVSIRLDPIDGRPEIEAHANVNYAGLCILGIEVVRLPDGRLILTFPEKPVRSPCAWCGRMVPITHPRCFNCGEVQPRRVPKLKPNGRPRIFHGVCFPSNAELRAAFEEAVFRAYHEARIGAIVAAPRSIAG